MGQDDVLVEVLINGKDMLQFYSTKENYKTLFEDRDALVDTVKTAFKEGVLYSADVNVDDIHTVEFLSEVAEVAVEPDTQEETQDGEHYETYEIIEEPIDTLTSSSIPEELVIDVGFSGADERLNLCPHCDYRTFNVGHFKIHMRQHTGESPFECNLCDYKSKQNSNLKRHMKQHLLGKDHFDCKLCNFKCSQEKIFKRHMILHSRTRPLRPCPFCDYFSTSLAHLTVHIRQHTGETPYHCGLCSYKTVQKSNLTRHLKKHRRGRTSKADKLRCCKQCAYRTPNPAHLMAHIRAAHTGETPYACQLCNYKSAQRSNLKRHLRKHSGERPFNCQMCNYSTAYPYVLKKHVENHPAIEITKYHCDFCDFATHSMILYKKHKRTHSGKPIHSCHLCGYITLNPDHLKAHLRKHAMEKPFKCRLCNYRSSQKPNVKRHYVMKHFGSRHKGVKPSIPTDGRASTSSSDENTQNEEISRDEEISSSEVVKVACNSDEAGVHKKKEVAEENTYIEDEMAVEVHMTEVEVERSVEVQELVGEHVEVVVNEEDVVTTPMEEQYTIIDEYEDGTRSAKLYRCNYCSYHSHDSEKVKLHIRQHTRERVYKCRFCGFQDTLKSNVRHHMRTHLGDKETIIPISEDGSPKGKNLSFLNKNQTEKLKEFKRLLQEGMKSHIGDAGRSHHEESLKRNSDADNTSENTESCTEETILEEDLQDSSAVHNEHYSHGDHSHPSGGTHSGYEGEPLNMAQLVAEDSSVLIVEHTDVDGEESSYEVETIEEEQEMEDATILIACELCGLETRTVSELKQHISTHTGEVGAEIMTPPLTPSFYTCDKCPFRAYRQADVGRHKTLFHGEKPPQRFPFICGSCSYRSASKSDFFKHLESHQSGTIKCKICELKVSSEDELKHHSRNHIGEEPFECYYCAYLTARKCHLKKHMKRRHNIARNSGKGPPYECYTCGYKTTQRIDFHNHITEHKSEASKTFACHVDRCRFLTLDQEVYKKHISLHYGSSKKEDSLEVAIAKASREAYLNDSRVDSDASKKFKRIPLKEYGNLPEGDRSKLILNNPKPPNGASLPIVVGQKKLFKDDESTSPLKKKRKGLRSLNPQDSSIENRFSRKFTFNAKNLTTSPKKIDTGCGIDFVGEVYKGHGSLRKFSHYGEVIKKSPNDMAIVLTHPENESQLKVVYNQLKEMMASLKKSGPRDTKVQLSVYFKEMEEMDIRQDESMTDVDIDISSDDDGSKNSFKGMVSDIDLDDLSDVDSLLDVEPKSKVEISTPNFQEQRKNGFKKIAPELVMDLDGEDKLHFIQEKIRERNEKRKQLRRIKAFNTSMEKNLSRA